MPDTYVQLPDGSYVQVPTGATPAQLQQFKIKLAGMQAKNQQAQIPDANAQAKQTLQNIPQYTSKTDELTQNLARAQSSSQYNDYMRQSGSVAAMAAGGMAGGAANLGTQGLPKMLATYGRAAAVGAGTGIGAFSNEPNKPMEALGTAAGTTATGMALSPVAKFIKTLGNLGNEAKAGPLFDAVSKAAGENTVDTSGALAAARRAKELQQAGFSMPRVISRFLARMDKPGAEPLNFDDARDFEQAAGGKLSTEEAMRIRPKMHAQLAKFADEMRKTTMKVA